MVDEDESDDDDADSVDDVDPGNADDDEDDDSGGDANDDDDKYESLFSTVCTDACQGCVFDDSLGPLQKSKFA